MNRAIRWMLISPLVVLTASHTAFAQGSENMPDSESIPSSEILSRVVDPRLA